MQGGQNADFIEWLLQARFSSPDGESGGVIMLTDGKLCGGNSDLMYLGSYTQNGDNFSADIVTKRLWLRTAGMIKADVDIKLVGRGFQNIMCIGSSPQLPGVELKAVFERVPF